MGAQAVFQAFKFVCQRPVSQQEHRCRHVCLQRHRVRRPRGLRRRPEGGVYAGALFVSALFGAGVTHFAGRNTAAATGDAQVEKLLPCSGGVKCREARWWAVHSGKFNSSSTAYHLTSKLSTWTTTGK